MSFARCTLTVLLVVGLSGCTMGLAATLLDEGTSVSPNAPADAGDDGEKNVRHAHAHEGGWFPQPDAAVDADAEAESDSASDAGADADAD